MYQNDKSRNCSYPSAYPQGAEWHGALKRELDELKDTVKAKIVATGEHKVETGGCIATYQKVTSNRFNSFALKAEDKATYDKYVVASTTARLTVE